MHALPSALALALALVVAVVGQHAVAGHVLLLLVLKRGRHRLRVEEQEEEADDELHQFHDGQHGDAHPQPQRAPDVGEEVGEAVGRELAILDDAEVLQVDVEAQEVLADEVGRPLRLLLLRQRVALLDEVLGARVVALGHQVRQVGQLGEEGVRLVHEVLLDVAAVEHLKQDADQRNRVLARYVY